MFEAVPSIPILASGDARRRVERLDLPFNSLGFDPYGIDKDQLARLYTVLGWMRARYFEAEEFGLEHVPTRGRAMLVGNHSGGIAIDGAMVMASLFFGRDEPRLAQGMAEKFLHRTPFASYILNRVGALTGLPEHAVRLLEDERLLMVFPEGARGTAKLFHERDSLVEFGTGFMRLSLQTGTPIVPFAFVGGGEAIPTVANLYGLGKLLGVPYVPVTPWVLPFPMPVRFELIYGAPMRFEGTGNEEDRQIRRYVEQVKERVGGLIAQARAVREGTMHPSDLNYS
ncbi:MAG: lysophospholipid acyltransferase family protein [Myxococcota bacterium]